MPLSSGISDYSRRLTILNPALGDSGYYECEAVLRSSSVPAVAEGAYLSVLGEAHVQRALGGLRTREEAAGGGRMGWMGGILVLTAPVSVLSLRRAPAVRQGAGEAHHGRDGEGGGHPVPSQRWAAAPPPRAPSWPRARHGPIRDAAPCLAGVPPPEMAWYKDAALLRPEQLPRFQLLEDGSLQISGLLPDDTGMFQCFARNAAGEVQTTTYLAVTSRCQPPPRPPEPCVGSG